MSQDINAQEFQTIGHYEIREKLAEGGFGVVYSARDPRLDRPVAIKVLHSYHASEPSRVARFVREARTAAKLNHPGIVQIYDVVEEDGRMALVMELVDGQNLDRYLKQHPELTLEDKVELAAQVADTLHVAHEAGIIHRDVKPANVIIDPSGRAKLTDFNLARLMDYSLTPLTGENSVLGTPAYMSPEQCQGHEAVAQSDIYSLGVMVYEMATDKVPFEAENYLALLRHHTDTPPTPIRLLKPSLPVELEKLIMRCLAKNIEDRPATAKDVSETLRDMASRKFVPLEDAAHRQTVVLSIEEPTAPAESPPRFAEDPREEAKRQSGELSGERSGERPTSAVLPKPPGFRRYIPYGVVAVMTVAVVLGISALWRFVPSDTTKPGRGVSQLWTETPLTDYVKAPDPAYTYAQHSKTPGMGYTLHVLDMTSQSWHSNDTKPGSWRHWVTIVAPERVTSDKAMLVFTEGFSTPERPMTEVPAIFLAMALTTKSLVVIMEGFPRDPVSFTDGTALTPDSEWSEFAVETFSRFLSTGDATWPIVCPLVKAAVRAMDTVQDYAQKELKLEAPISTFLLTGDANGWGVWLTEVVDSRVGAIAPVGFDLLNVSAQIEHQVGFRGELSSFLNQFSLRGLMPELDTEEGERLLHIIDPYQYRAQLAIPKLVLLPGAENPYTTIDAASLYQKDLTGDTYFFAAPNLTLSRSNAFLAQQGTLVEIPRGYGRTETTRQDFRDTLQVFYHRFLVDKPMPQFRWKVEPDGSFEVLTDDRPVEARLWLAKSDTREFSFDPEEDAEAAVPAEATAAVPQEPASAEEVPDRPSWQVEVLNYKTEGFYSGKVLLSEKKYTAFYVELVYPSILGVNFSLTTPTTVLTAPEIPTQVEETQALAPGYGRTDPGDTTYRGYDTPAAPTTAPSGGYPSRSSSFYPSSSGQRHPQ